MSVSRERLARHQALFRDVYERIEAIAEGEDMTVRVGKPVTPGPAPVAKTAVVAAAVTPGRAGRRRRRI